MPEFSQQEAMEGLDASLIKGIGFDATCSLVAMDTNFKPITVSKSGEIYSGTSQSSVFTQVKISNF